MTNKDCLYDWLFHYNHYTKLWAAFRREDSNAYFSNFDDPKLKVYKSTKVDTLIDILIKFECDTKKIDKIRDN